MTLFALYAPCFIMMTFTSFSLLFSQFQCFDTPSLYMEQRSDSGVSITSNQNGPPPSYEAVVALDGIRKCSNVNCPLGKTMNIDDDTCGDDVHKSGLTIEDMESANDDDGVLDNSDKYYGETKCNEDHLIMCPRCAPPPPHQSNNNHLCDCNNLIAGIVSQTTPCRNCGELFDAASDANVTNCNQMEGNNKCCYNYMTTPNPNGQIMDEENPTSTEQQSNSNVEMLNCVNNNNLMGVGDEVNNNNDSNGLSSATTTTTSNDDTNDDNNNNATVNTTTNTVDLQQINENGIIRLDMSQIIDSTGLPTYEAAIKLEQSGYV